jgi:hypothetical protein
MNNSIEFKQFDFRLTAKEPLIHPSYKGSTLRGSFIYAFKRVVCMTLSLPSNQLKKPGIQI